MNDSKWYPEAMPDKYKGNAPTTWLRVIADSAITPERYSRELYEVIDHIEKLQAAVRDMDERTTHTSPTSPVKTGPRGITLVEAREWRENHAEAIEASREENSNVNS